MKKLIFALLILSAASCKKDNPEPSSTKECNCGIVTNDGIDGTCYWLEIKNHCSGNKKVWCFDQATWTSAPVGSNFCVTNVTEW
jgi:hypothetical protein